MLIVTLIKGDKVYIGSEQPKSAIGKISACEAIWTQATEKADRLRADNEAAKGKNHRALDAELAEPQGEKDFQSCWMERASKEPFYPAVVEEAQAFADRIAGK